jgi:D-serine deaminase-like pyridoxal phosphate-dependent protein
MTWNNLPEDHPTPSLVVSAQIVRKNIRSMQDYCNQNHLHLRPHTKTHKSILVAREQMAAGAVGLTVAKIGEAEIMANATKDIMLAYPAIGTNRLRRLTELAGSSKLRVAIDSKDAADMIQSSASRAGVQIEVLVDVDVGFRRTGVIDPNGAIELCEYMDRQSHLRFVGLMCFPGHILPSANADVWAAYTATLEHIVDGLKQKGLSVETISGGSTPTARFSHRNPLLTEIRPGTYVYNDLNEVRLGVCELSDCAARVLATVVSVPEPHKFVIDAGSKTLSSDRNAANPDAGFGYVVEYPDAKVTRLSEEHGEISIPTEKLDSIRLPKVGDRVWIIPNHICVCVNLQNTFFWLDGQDMISLPVDARGMLV